MRTSIFIAVLVIMLFAAGCGTAGEKNTSSGDTVKISGEEMETADVVIPDSEENITGTDIVADVDEEDEPVAGPDGSDTVPDAGDVEVIESVGDEEIATYIEKIAQIAERHIRTKQDTTDAIDDFGSTNYVFLTAKLPEYRDKLGAALARAESELVDAGAITPPNDFTDFHGTFVDAVESQRDALASLHKYYADVVETGTGELEDYTRGMASLTGADGLWWSVVKPQVDALLAETTS